MQENKNSQDSRPPQASLILRVCGGGYLVYLAWDLFTNSTGVWITLAAVVFGLVGGALLGTSLWTLAHSEYFYDKKDEPKE